MKIDMNKIKNYLNSIKIGKLTLIIGIILLMIVSFQFGIFIGFGKASFNFRNGERYFLEMNGRRDDPMMGLRRDDFQNTYGTIGKIIKISPDIIIVLDKDQKEKTISISTSTIIKKFREDIKPINLKIDDFITVIGSPEDNGFIGAKLIRVMPDINNMPLPEIK